VLAVFAATAALAATFTVAAVVRESVSSKSDAAVATAATPTLTVPKGWKLTFNQGFSGTKLNTKVWSTCYWWAAPGAGCTNTGNSSEEKEWYLPSQDQVSGGELHLVAKREVTDGTNANGKLEKFYCRSGMVTTSKSFNFEYGFAQLVVRVPYGSGLWPALWLAASNHDWPPEVDLLEHWDSQTNAGVYLHPTDGVRQGGRVNLPSNFSEGWHSVTLSWTKTRITWYLDDHQVFSTTKDLPQQKMYLVMNVADTSTAAGACNGTMLVKSVKVWQPKA
jgi:beta-glucanase (GH16 family)